MKFSVASAAVALAGALFGTAFALDPIVVKDNKFFNSKSGSEFYFKGIAYQPENGEPDPQNRDPLADSVGCKRDVEALKDLGVNAIRVYQTDYTKNHDSCMKAFSDAGIYVVLDVPAPSYAINRKDPEWTTEIFAQYRAKIDAFSKYDNVAGYVIGNEVSNDKDTTKAAAYVKAATRDIKQYLKKNKLTTPVGYASNDEPDIRDQLAAYFVCSDEKVDFYGINLYQWCADMTFESSGYADVVKQFTDYPVPVLLTEYGCNAKRPRTFDEVASLYGKDMNSVFSGGFAYEYTEEDNEYGMVKVSYGKKDLEKTQDYDNFKKALAKASPKSSATFDSYSQKGAKKPECPSPKGAWHVSKDKLPPTPSTDACDCIKSSLSCVLKGNITDGEKAGKAYADICGKSNGKACSEVTGDAEKGEFGAFSFCDLATKLVYAASKYSEDGGEQCKALGSDGARLDKSSNAKDVDAEQCAKKKTDVDTESNNNGKGSSEDSSDDSSEDSNDDSSDDSSENSNSEDADSSATGSAAAQRAFVFLGLVASIAMF